MENVETIPLHFTLELEGLRDQGSLNELSNLHGVLHGMQWIMSHGLLDLVISPPRRGESNTNSGEYDTSDSHNPWFIIRSYCVEGPT